MMDYWLESEQVVFIYQYLEWTQLRKSALVNKKDNDMADDHTAGSPELWR
jgi:hypothetical protein